MINCRVLVCLFLFCGVSVMGASLANVSSSHVNESLHDNSTMAVKSDVAHLLLNETKSANASASNQTHENPKAREVEVVLKNLTGSSLNSTEIDAKSNTTDKSKTREVKALDETDLHVGNETAKASVNATVKVERAADKNLTATNATTSTVDESSRDGLNETAESANNTSTIKEREVEDLSVNMTVKLAANETAKNETSKTARAALDKDNSTKSAVNATSEDVKSADNLSGALRNATSGSKTNATEEADLDDDKHLNKGDDTILMLRRELSADNSSSLITQEKEEEMVDDTDLEEDIPTPSED